MTPGLIQGRGVRIFLLFRYISTNADRKDSTIPAPFCMQAVQTICVHGCTYSTELSTEVFAATESGVERVGVFSLGVNHDVGRVREDVTRLLNARTLVIPTLPYG